MLPGMRFLANRAARIRVDCFGVNDSNRDRDLADPELEVRAAQQELQAAQHRVLVGGRWLLLAAELLVAALHVGTVAGSRAGALLFIFLVVYDVAALAALVRLPIGQIGPGWLLAVDVITVGWLAAVTNGIASPFAGLFYLISLMGAVYFDVAGGLTVAIGGSAIMLLGAWAVSISPTAQELERQRRQFIPFLFLCGGIAGYLVRELKALHARRIEIAEEMQRLRYEVELRHREDAVAREIQRATLPEPLDHPACQAVVRFEPARDVGGDFYSFLEGGSRLGIIVGDVSGKGIPAALVSTSICHLSHCLPAMEDPGRFMRDVNNDLLERLPDWAFATMTFAVIDSVAERMEVYNAGHPPPLIVSGGIVRRAGPPNIVLGAVDDARFAPDVLGFRGGDTLVLYTDGFIEARNERGEQMGVERLEALVAAHAGLAPDEMASRILEAVRSSWKVSDDLTLIIARATRAQTRVTSPQIMREYARR